LEFMKSWMDHYVAWVRMHQPVAST
jgi:hypothetical protein